MSEIVKSVVYYNPDGLPVLCYNNDCVDCKYDCFDAIVKIIPVEVDIEQEALKGLAKGLEKTSKSFGRFSKEMKKTVDSLSKLRNKI